MRSIWHWLKGGSAEYLIGGPIPSKSRFILVQICLWIYSTAWLSGWGALIVWRSDLPRWFIFFCAVLLFIFMPPFSELFRRYGAYTAAITVTNSVVDTKTKK